MLTSKQCVVGKNVWYQPSPGVRFLMIVNDATRFTMGVEMVALKTDPSKISYSMWKGRGRSGYYDYVSSVPLSSLFPFENDECTSDGCKGDPLCTACSTFVCGTCNQLRPACVGANDDHPDDCDECANKKDAATRGHEICPGCKAEIDPETCGCGAAKPKLGYCDNHGFIPMGCNCGRSREPLAQLCECGCPALHHSSIGCRKPVHGWHRYKMEK